MRLIDADALMRAMYHRTFETNNDTMWQSGCWVRYRAIEQVAKEQPTVEAKRGRWINCGGDIGNYIKCAICGTVYAEPVAHAIYPWNFCPNCGADMREEGE